MSETMRERDCLLWYNTPGERWTDALPLGNGRIGAMVFGRGADEQIQIDENTFWSGCRSGENDDPETFTILGKLREQLLKPDYEAADQLGKRFVGQKNQYGTNMPTGNLLLSVTDAEEKRYEASALYRSLSLRTGIALNRFEVFGKRFSREVFVSEPDQVFALRMTSDDPFSLEMSYRGIDNNCGIYGEIRKVPGNVFREDGAKRNGCAVPEEETMRNLPADCLIYGIRGDARETLHSDGTCGVHLEGALAVLTDGACTVSDGIVTVRNCTELTLFMDLETTMFREDPAKTALARVLGAVGKRYDAVRRAHIADVAPKYDRMSLFLGEDPALQALPTDERLARAAAGGEDPGLYALLFQYGRYLLLASSRESSLLPTHMGGIWNDNIYNRLDCAQDMHIDMNLEMQYWLAAQCALPECYAPFFAYLENVLIPNGKKSAEVTYGADGFCAGVVSNPWGFTGLGWSYNWGVFALGGAWCAAMAWDYYTWTGDRAWLREHGISILREAAAFAADYCFYDESRGIYQCGPSYSPENMFRSGGKDYFLSLSTTCDVLLVREILTDYLKALKVPGVSAAGSPDISASGTDRDKSLAARAADILGKLPPYRIGTGGRLQEWFEDVEDAIPNHRHTSHLLGLYPFRQIVPGRDEALAAAAVKSMDRRHEDFEITSWGMNLLVGYNARLGRPEAAKAMLDETIAKIVKKNLSSVMSDGDSMWMGEWELDGNTGLTAAFLELFLQSFEEETILLPALPAVWKAGSLTGAPLKGGHTADLFWEDGALSRAVFHGSSQETVKIVYKNKIYAAGLNPGEDLEIRFKAGRPGRSGKQEKP